MAPKHLIVKRHGHMEEFDEKKVYASVYSAALNAHMGEQDAERLAEKTMKAVKKHFKKAEKIDSEDIRDAIVEELGGEQNDVAYLYTHHLDIN